MSDHKRLPDAVSMQRAYYARTAPEYDHEHVIREPEHNIALRYIAALLSLLSAKSVLDVGCGTGRGIEYLRDFDPRLTVLGVDPVSELLDVALAKRIPPSRLIKADACTLPFHDGEFDAVMALGVLHHVPHPGLVVREMQRVAKKAIFISDGNLFGKGAMPLRGLKLLLYKAGIWNLVKTIQTRGRGYFVTEGDGIAYSYSAFFEYELMVGWADRVFTVPTSPVKPSRWPRPILRQGSVLLCALRDSD